MSGIRLPRAVRSTVKRVRTTDESPQNRLNRVLRHINPIQKEVVQRKLFVEQHIKGLDNQDILSGVDIDPVLRRELEHIYQQPVRKMDLKGHGKSTDFVPESLDFAIKKLKSNDIRRSHEYFFKTSSVMIIFEDMSRTMTNKMYHNNIIKKIKALSNAADTVTTKNMDPETLQQMMCKNENLVRELQKIEDLGAPPQLKSLCIPPHAIDLTEKIFDIVLEQSPHFEIVSVLFNLKTSSRLNLEFRKAFDTAMTEQMPKDINYDSLLKMAQKSHDTRNGVAMSILTRIGQAAFLDVSVTDDCISLTRRQ